MHPPDLHSLGRRIVIMGPSNAGKSTLCLAIAEKLGVPAVHLDQFRHLPNTDWVSRSDEEFRLLHDAAIAKDSWVMDGNYTKLLPQRLERATGAIVIDDGTLPRFARYLWRTLFQADRPGNLDGARDSLKWEMVDWILIKTRRSGERSRGLISKSGLPHVFCRSMRELRALYVAWGLPARA